MLTPVIPALERLQKEEGELGRQQIKSIYKIFNSWLGIILSTGIAFVLVKPVVFNWNLCTSFKNYFSLTTGSMLSMWFAELITNEKLR